MIYFGRNENVKIRKIKDERIIQLNNKIQKEAFYLVLLLLGLSIFIKAYILNMAVSEYITELIIMIASLIYTTIRGSIVGYNSVDTSKHGKKLMVFTVLGLSLFISISTGIRNYSLYGGKYTGIFDSSFITALIFTFISSAIFISLILVLVSFIDKLGQKRLEKKLEDAEE